MIFRNVLKLFLKDLNWNITFSISFTDGKTRFSRMDEVIQVGFTRSLVGQIVRLEPLGPLTWQSWLAYHKSSQCHKMFAVEQNDPLPLVSTNLPKPSNIHYNKFTSIYQITSCGFQNYECELKIIYTEKLRKFWIIHLSFWQLTWRNTETMTWLVNFVEWAHWKYMELSSLVAKGKRIYNKLNWEH